MSKGESIPRRHVVAGFAGLLVFALLGVALESFHAFKAPLYLDVGNETRRLMWRLAHAHGVLLAVVNVVYGLAAERFSELRRPLAARALLAAMVLLPVGFFAGGITIRGGDPGFGIVLVPLGAAALIAALVSIVLALRAR